MSDRSTKDKEMAAHLKKRGVQRLTQRCPVCYRIVGCGPKFKQHIDSGCKSS